MHRRSIRCSVFDVRCSVFWFSLFLLTPSVFGQSQTNALPNLLPPLAPIPPTFWDQHHIAIVVGALILIVLIATGVWKILKPGPPSVMPPAYVAGAVLAKCIGRPEEGKVLSEISRALRRYVGAVLGFPAGELTTGEFRHELECSEKITPPLKNDIFDFLRVCDERKFSPTVSAPALNAAGRAQQFIAVIEEEIRKQETASATNK
jgi:hypothetical protein